MPDWAVLGKDIGVLKDQLKEKLATERAYYGENPTKEDRDRWDESIRKCSYFIDEINGKIKKFKFVCPTIQQQLVPTRLELFTDKIFYGDTWRKNIPAMLEKREAERNRRPVIKEKSAADDQGGLMSLFSFILK